MEKHHSLKALIITVTLLAVLLLFGVVEIIRMNTEKVEFTCDHCHQSVFEHPHDILVEDADGKHIDLTVCSECLEKYNALPDGEKYKILYE